jgi:hypothetical protein
MDNNVIILATKEIIENIGFSKKKLSYEGNTRKSS